MKSADSAGVTSATTTLPALEEMTGSLVNSDLAPIPVGQRTWGRWNFAALWISMAACIPTYMLASGLIKEGMNWWQAILTILLANMIVLIPMVLNAHAGTKYGISFPVYCRASFGVLGANVPALLRAFVACGWFGIQTWIGGAAIHKIMSVFFPVMSAGAPLAGLGINWSELLCFVFFWAINVWVIYRGIDSIRLLLLIKAPLLIILGLALLWWAYDQAGGLGPMLSTPSAFDPGQPKEGKFWIVFVPSLTGMIGFWATLSLNIPDFSRYAKSQRDQVIGQSIGLPPTMALYAFIGVAVTSATVVIFHGEPIWDPVDVLTRFESPIVLIVAMLALCIATLATNIAANVVSPANDFAHLWPRRISFATGGLITAIIGVVIMPWKLLANSNTYIFTLLGAYSALLGPIGGILIADYFAVRRCHLNLSALYDSNGEYKFCGGFSLVALISMVMGILPSIPGFLVQIEVIDSKWRPAIFVSGYEFLVSLYHAAWFVGFGIAFVFYWTLRRLAPNA